MERISTFYTFLLSFIRFFFFFFLFFHHILIVIHQYSIFSIFSIFSTFSIFSILDDQGSNTFRHYRRLGDSIVEAEIRIGTKREKKGQKGREKNDKHRDLDLFNLKMKKEKT